jgi:opacity protein-like surface antigen
MVPVGDATNIYGLVGLAKTTTQGSLRRTDVEGLAFGGGVEYDLSSDKKKDAKYDREFDGKGDQEKGLGLFVDYERLYYESGSPDLDAVSAGVTYDF